MTTAPIKKKEDIEAVKGYFLQKGKVRDYTLFVMGINTGMKISSLIALRWQDVYDYGAADFVESIDISDKKSDKRTYISLNESCRSALKMLQQKKEGNFLPSDYIFESQSQANTHITRFWAFKTIKKAAETLGLEGNISCHSMKKTLYYNVLKEGRDMPLMLDLCGNSNFEATKKYLGIAQEEANAVHSCPNL